MADIARFRVLFDDDAFNEDLSHASPAGRHEALAARKRLEKDGLTAPETKPCLGLGPEGTQLGGCVKVYLPPPAGPWGMVLRLVRDGPGVALYCLAFGIRHPVQAWQPSVYRVADRRLHAGE